MRRMTVLVVSVVLLAACGSQPGDVIAAGSTTTAPTNTVEPPASTTGPTGPLTPEGELEAARTRWAAAALDTYSYRFYDDCGECDQLPEQTAVVWDGEVMDPLRRAASVDEAFALIENALARGEDVEVEYDPDLGYPTDLWIDREARAYDGGTHLVFSSVEPGLPGDEASLEAHRDARARWEEAALTSYEYTSAVICDCEFQVSMHTKIVDGLVVEFDTRTPEPTDITFSPLTITQMLDDVEILLGGEDFESEGIRVTGSAQYDARYGHPVWIGLDIEVTDPAAAAEAGFPPRLIMTVSDLTPIVPDPASELEQARARWDAEGPDTYVFDIVLHDVIEADFTDEFTVEVVDDVVVSVLQNGSGVPPEDLEIPTIEGVFDLIAALSLAGSSVDVIYDVTLGYPTVVVAVDPDGTSATFSISLRG